MELIIPNKTYLQSYLDAIEEYKKHQVTTYAFLDPYKNDIFEQMEEERTGSHLPEGYVKATHLWLVDEGMFLGEISVRHELTDSLLRFGGNIGYGIRYSHWNRGLGTVMLSMALDYAKETIGLSKVLITCNDDNYGSARVIEHNGGRLLDKIVNNIDRTDRVTRRYWINL